MKALLLNSSYEVISFITFKRALKLHFNNKAEILSSWNDSISWISGKIQYPAVLRLKYNVPWRNRKMRCTRKAVLRRDRYTCQYCNKGFKTEKLTWDHVVPRSKGGKSVWTNVITSCIECNTRKGDRTPEEAEMPYVRKPLAPNINISNEYSSIKIKHKDWGFYLV